MDYLSAIVEFFNLRTLLILALIFVPLERLLSCTPSRRPCGRI